MKKLFTENSWNYRLIRTIIQGIIGVIIANLDLIVGFAVIDVTLRPLIVAVVMAVLSPIMAALGDKEDANE